MLKQVDIVIVETDTGWIHNQSRKIVDLHPACKGDYEFLKNWLHNYVNACEVADYPISFQITMIPYERPKQLSLF